MSDLAASSTQDSLNSSSSERNLVDGTFPQPLDSEAYRSSSRTQRPSTLLETISRTISGQSNVSSVSGYTARELYGDISEGDINLRRTNTVNTILTTLSRRASETERSAQRRLTNTSAIDVENRSNESEEAEEKKQEKVSAEYPAEVPENVLEVKGYGAEFSSLDPELITWEGPNDPMFPRNWPRPKKWVSTLIVSLYTFVSPLSSSMLSPGMSDIADDFNLTKQSLKSLIVSIFILAWALAPLFSAPLSEMYGRKIILNVSIVCLFAFNLGCSFAQNTSQMIVLRFFAGCSGAAPLSIGPGVLGDLWDDKERNFAMAFYSIGPTFGPVFGPIVAGFVVENCGWRWIFWVLCIVNGVTALIGLVFYRETYSPTLLRAKAAKLRKQTGNANLRTIYDIADGSTKTEKLLVNMARPLKLLTTNPVVIGLGSFMAFVYGFMYLMIVTFPEVWGNIYGFNKGISGLMYLPMGIGFGIGIGVWTWAVGYFYETMKAKNGGVAKPEFRLPTLIFAGIGCPVGLIWYGWSAQKHIHWIMPSIGSGIFAFHLITVFQSIQNYLIDMNPRFAASLAAAGATFRSLFGFAFPLFAPYMYEKLHYGWGNTLFAFIGFGLGIPFPLFMLKYGERLRLWGNAKMDLEQAKRDKKWLARLQKKQAAASNGASS